MLSAPVYFLILQPAIFLSSQPQSHHRPVNWRAEISLCPWHFPWLASTEVLSPPIWMHGDADKLYSRSINVSFCMEWSVIVSVWKHWHCHCFGVFLFFPLSDVSQLEVSSRSPHSVFAHTHNEEESKDVCTHDLARRPSLLLRDAEVLSLSDVFQENLWNVFQMIQTVADFLFPAELELIIHQKKQWWLTAFLQYFWVIPNKCCGDVCE